MTVGCSSKYQVKLDSMPQGATVVCGGTRLGYTPLTIVRHKDAKNPSYIDAADCSARWSSGVSASYPARLKVSPDGPNAFTLHRPDAPGYEKDERFAQSVKNTKQDRKFSELDSTGKNHPSNMLCSYVGAEKTCL